MMSLQGPAGDERDVAYRRLTGRAYNWAIQKRWFADYTPVVDFIHVLGYVRLAASATGTSGWRMGGCEVSEPAGGWTSRRMCAN